MFRQRLIHKFLLIFLIFAVTLLASTVLITHDEYSDLRDGHPITEMGERLFEDMLVLLFYGFFFAFLLSLFLSRNIMLSLNKLQDSARSLREGNLDVTIPILTRDELGDVINGFNSMAAALRDKTVEIDTRNKEVEEARDFFRTTINSIRDEIVIIDRELNIIDVNSAVMEQIGKPFSEIIGRKCHEILHNSEEMCSLEDCPTQAVFATGNVYRTTHKHLAGQNGDAFFHEVLACPIKDSRGSVRYVIEVLRDVTTIKQYEDDLQVKNRELTALNSIAAVLTQALDTRIVITNVVRKLLDMVGMKDGGVLLVDDTRKDLVCYLTQRRLTIGDNTPSTVLNSGQVFATGDLSGSNREAMAWLSSDVRSCCCVPLRGKDKTLGVLYMISDEKHHFSDEERAILSSAGDMIGIAIENTKLYETINALYEYQRNRRKQEHDNLFAVSSHLSAATDLNEAIDNSLRLIMGFLKADLGILFTMTGENRLALRSTLNNSSSLTGKPEFEPGEGSPEWQALINRKPFVAKGFGQPSPEGYPLASAVCAVAAPLYSGIRPVGVFSLYFTTMHEFREEELHYIEILSSMLAVALERSALYEKILMETGFADIVFRSISDGVYTVDPNCMITSANKTAEKIFGLPVAEMIGKKCTDVIMHKEPGTDHQLCRGECTMSRALAGKAARGETDFVTLDGRRIPMSLHCSPLFNMEGKLIGAAEVFRDMTKEREIDQMKTDFVRTVSHEFRTPLSAIVGMTEMLHSKEVEGARADEYLNTILQEGKRLTNIVSDLLDISRIESGSEIFEMEEIDFPVLLNDIQKTFSDIIRQKMIKMTITGKDDVRGFRGDRGKLKQLLINLVGNAAMYSDPGCTIDIRVEKENSFLKMTVSDTGWGISSEDIPHLTTKFFRGKHGIRTKGTGLGLSLCREIARVHNGTLSFESAPGKGTTVTVGLPFPPPPAEA